ncbi:hypothetical protein V0M98_37025 (plasmid) [Pseudomonas silesiensis]|uniref:hypothetical protein n=1 Tax=Pseudomonas silesiensis TaxID=1853130 RepID=UPI0030CE0EF5
MRPLFKSVLFGSLVLLAACSKGPTIDATTDETLNNSLNALYQSLSPNESEKLRQDITWLNTYFERRIYKGEKVEDAQSAYVLMLNGKTPDEISEQVDALRPYEQKS